MATNRKMPKITHNITEYFVYVLKCPTPSCDTNIILTVDNLNNQFVSCPQCQKQLSFSLSSSLVNLVHSSFASLYKELQKANLDLYFEQTRFPNPLKPDSKLSDNT